MSKVTYGRHRRWAHIHKIKFFKNVLYFGHVFYFLISFYEVDKHIFFINAYFG